MWCRAVVVLPPLLLFFVLAVFLFVAGDALLLFGRVVVDVIRSAFGASSHRVITSARAILQRDSLAQCANRCILW